MPASCGMIRAMKSFMPSIRAQNLRAGVWYDVGTLLKRKSRRSLSETSGSRLEVLFRRTETAAGAGNPCAAFLLEGFLPSP